MKPIIKFAGGAIALAAVGATAFWLGQQQAQGSMAGKPAPAGAAAMAPGKPGAPTGGPPPVTVEVAPVAQVAMPRAITAVGSLRSDESVVVRPEVAGRVAEILFREGQRARKGQVLVRLDASVQQADTQQAKANLNLAQSKYERARDLSAKGFISSQALDEAQSTYKVAEATYQVTAARLAKMEIRAPFSGVIGLRSVSIGDYVKDGQDIVNLEEIDPLKVDFRVPEVFMGSLKTGQTLQLGLDAFPGKEFQGKVFAINPLVESTGRAIVVRALIGNNDAALRPGMFARVRLLLGDENPVLAIPEQSLVPVGEDNFVFKVVNGSAVRSKIEIGQRRDGKVEVVQGLVNGDRVVIAGQQKLRDGAAVRVADSQTLVPTAGTPATPVVDPKAPPAAAKKAS